jgi:hypothetical protein
LGKIYQGKLSGKNYPRKTVQGITVTGKNWLGNNQLQTTDNIPENLIVNSVLTMQSKQIRIDCCSFSKIYLFILYSNFWMVASGRTEFNKKFFCGIFYLIFFDRNIEQFWKQCYLTKIMKLFTFFYINFWKMGNNHISIYMF